MDNDTPSEFEVQAEAFFNLKARFNVRGEYHFRNNGLRVARFDLAILSSDGVLRLIVEVKKKNRARSWAQAQKYGQLTGLPVIYIRGMDQAKEAVSIVLNHLKQMNLTEEYIEVGGLGV